MSRHDIPADLLARAAAVDPSLARWLEVAYQTDAERAREIRRRRHQEKQLALPLEARR